FSGSFSWRRHSPLFERQWDSYDYHWCGSESHLGRVYRVGEVESLYGDRPPRGLDLYLSSVWEAGLLEAHRRWCEVNRSRRLEPILATVILTSARQPILVHEAIDSVRRQTADAWQLVIMDAGDLAAAGAFDRYRDDPRIVILTTGETVAERSSTCIQGVAINRAMASGRVRGDVLACLSDDDKLDLRWVETVLNRAADWPTEQGWVGAADVQELRADGSIYSRGMLAVAGQPGPANPLRCRVDGCQLAVRRSAWKPWPEDRAQAAEADGYWMDSIAAAVEVVPLTVRAAVHRHTPLSTFTRPAC
ncbi:MAG TPA: glycosyltransferase family A protein, partial [Gammaproteobacteria bacterium]|nr:glycosyltransferase family A protein [Gammaproteobacteria bacterium]